MFVWFIVDPSVSLDQNLSWRVADCDRASKRLQGTGPVDPPPGARRSDVVELGCAKAFKEPWRVNFWRIEW